MSFRKVFSLFLLTTCLLGTSVFAQTLGNSVPQPSRGAGYFNASAYGRYNLHTTSNTAASAGAVIADNVNIQMSPFEGRLYNPLTFVSGKFPSLLVDLGAAQETVVPTAISGCGLNAQNSVGTLGSCIISGTFTNAHGANALIVSGTFGLQEALLDAFASGGGTVVVDQNWTLLGGTTAMITSAATGNLGTTGVWIWDIRGPAPRLYGKSGSGTAVYSDTNNDITGSGASPLSKTLSVTYGAAPTCVAAGTTGAATATTSTTSNVSVTCTGTCTYHCDY